MYNIFYVYIYIILIVLVYHITGDDRLHSWERLNERVE